DLIAKNGRRISVEVSTRLIREHGKVVGVQGTVRDLTVRRHTERALQSSEQKLLLHLKQTLLGVIEWNTNFEVVEWNEGAEKIFGFNRGEVLGRHASLIVPKQAKEHVDRMWRDLLSQQGGTRSTNENLRKDGRIILCEWFNTPLVDSQGRVMAVASLVQDVTERKRAEEALRISEERYRLLFERNLAGVYWTSLDGDFVDCNESFARIFGYGSRFEVLGKSSTDLYATTVERSNLLRRLQEQKTLTNVEWQGRPQEGTPIWVLENDSLVENQAKPLIQGQLVVIHRSKVARR